MAPTRRWLALTAFVALIAGAGGVSAGILIASPPTPASPCTVTPPTSPAQMRPLPARPFRRRRELPSRRVLSPARLMAFPFLPWPCPPRFIRTWWTEPRDPISLP